MALTRNLKATQQFEVAQEPETALLGIPRELREAIFEYFLPSGETLYKLPFEDRITTNYIPLASGLSSTLQKVGETVTISAIFEYTHTAGPSIHVPFCGSSSLNSCIKVETYYSRSISLDFSQFKSRNLPEIDRCRSWIEDDKSCWDWRTWIAGAACSDSPLSSWVERVYLSYQLSPYKTILTSCFNLVT